MEEHKTENEKRKDMIKTIEPIFERIKNGRESLGITKKELATYLSESWGMTKSSANTYMTDRLEYPGEFSTTIAYSKKIFMKRLSDYLVAVEFSEDKVTEIFAELRAFCPEMKPIKSEVQPYRERKGKKTTKNGDLEKLIE